MINIGVVVVTFNRLECLKKNIDSLLKLKVPYTAKINIVIINNHSTDGTIEFLNNINDEFGINVINMRENTGGSGGFYAGVKWCLNQGMDYVWGMDDDAYPDANALYNILDMVDKYGKECCYWSNCNKDNDFCNDVKEVLSWMFVGFFISAEIIKKIGLPKSDYFIYHDDSEYAYRIIKNGYRILKCKDSVIEHKDGISTYYSGKSFLGRKIENYSILPDWKSYYDVRNMCLMYPVCDINYWKVIFTYYPKILVAATLYDRKQLKIIIKAIYHGIIRKSGIVVRP